MQLVTIASGSSGNCALLSQDDAHLLIDCGVSCRRIATALAGLGVDPSTLLGVLITHEHSDHIAGLATLTKRFRLPLWTSPGTAGQLLTRVPGVRTVLRTVLPGGSFSLGPFTVETFPTSHDASQSMGFSISCGDKRAAVATDLGYVSEEVLDGVLGCQLLLCEANHDVDFLRSGPYPPYLKARILSDRGHLSNEAGAALALQCAAHGAKTVVLAHLSAQNNTPALALQTAGAALSAAGFTPGRDVTLAVAPRSCPSPIFEV